MTALDAAIQQDWEEQIVRSLVLKHSALVALIALVKRTGGYMSPEDQRTLWEAECAARDRL